MVITALSSCSADNSSLILCNVKLEEDEYSRRLTSTVTSNTISASAIYYHPEYLGTGNSYSEINSDKTSITDDVTGEKYILYNDGILLSQGLWNIKCKWTDESGKTVLEGETGPTWINLNTTLIYVHCGSRSFSLTYSVISNSISTPFLSLSIFPFENGNISETPLSSYNNIKVEDNSKLSSVKTGNKTVFTLDDSSFNESGYFVLVITVKELETSSTVMFTDVIGFASKPGSSPTLKGSCEVEEGSSGGSCVYLPEISDPTDPTRGEQGEVVEITNSPTKTDDGTSQAKLNEVEIKDDKIYIINVDTSSKDNSMTLGHTTSDTSTSTRIKPPENADFGVNLNGTNVKLTVGEKYWGLGPYYSESSAIIELCPNTSMTLYNNNKKATGVDAGWAYIAGSRRFDANTLLKGGTMNIVGSNASDNISNAQVFFIGATASDNSGADILSYEWIKQGAINIYSGTVEDNNSKQYTSLGGNIVLDGNVEVKAVTGVSTWSTHNTPDDISSTGFIYTPTIKDKLETNISIINSATISATGDTGSYWYKDTATGIYILGNAQTGTINIVLDKGHISTTGSGTYDSQNYPSVFEAGIRIENFTGSINIELKNGSTISSDNGYGIYLNNCTGGITIKKDNNSSITGKLSPVYIDGSAQQFSNGEITKSATSSSTSV